MFKKVIVSLLLCVASAAFAKEVITIVWPFGFGSNQANTIRAMIIDANASQDAYELVLENKPGAGGVVAANYVSGHSHNTVLAMSSSFFVRPNFPGSGPVYAIDKFTPVFVQAVGSPIAVLSKRYSSYKEIPLTDATTVGTAGVGTLSDLVAAGILNTRRVPYQSMIAADKDVIGMHIDISTDFLGDISGLVDSGIVNVIGITGTRQIGNLIPLEKQGIKGFDKLVANYGIYASTDMSEGTLVALHKILAQANQRPLVIESYNRDYLTPVTMNIRQSQVWFKEQTQFWRIQSEKINK